MKKIFTSSLFLLVFICSGFAQNCQGPVNASVFQTGFNSIAVQQNDQLKLIKATRFTGDKCLMASQIKTIALLFASDSVRLDFCKTAYAHTYDPANFYDVYDAFHAFSYALRLYNFVENYGGATGTADAAPATVSFPNYAYPDTLHYTGKKGCRGPAMTENAFRQAAQNVFVQPTDESKYVAAQGLADQNCLTFAQAMKLASLMQTDNFKMRVLTYSFPKVYDQEHYQSGIVLFSTTQSQNDWSNYAKAYLTPPPPECKVSDADFKSVLQNVQAKSCPADKISAIELASKDRCFSVAQIRTLSKEFTFGEDKMKVFKKLYAKCNDKNNYYQLVDELTFNSEKDELKRFINAGGN